MHLRAPSVPLRWFVKYIIECEYARAIQKGVFVTHAATTVKHMCFLLDFMYQNGHLAEDERESALEDVLYAQHLLRTVRAYMTLYTLFRSAFVDPKTNTVRLGPRRWYVQVLVHDVRADCLIVGRTGNPDEYDDVVDGEALPRDPLKICIPKAASILIQPTDTIRGDLYRIDDDHFVFGNLTSIEPFDVDHKPPAFYIIERPSLTTFAAPLSDPLRARTLDPAFLVSPDSRAYTVPESIIPTRDTTSEVIYIDDLTHDGPTGGSLALARTPWTPSLNSRPSPPTRFGDGTTSRAPFATNYDAYEIQLAPDEVLDHHPAALAPRFYVYGPDGLPRHHMRHDNAPKNDESGSKNGEADTILPHADVTYQRLRARLLARASPFGTPARIVYPKGVSIKLPGPDYDVARAAGLMGEAGSEGHDLNGWGTGTVSTERASASSGIPPNGAPLPQDHIARIVFNMAPFNEAWYKARESIFEDRPENYAKFVQHWRT
ncbi:hypothetical protein EV714DRAFT_281289 [Schizophyllum commune]